MPNGWRQIQQVRNIRNPPEHLRFRPAPVITMIHVDGKLEQYDASFSASIPDNLVERAEQARDIFNQYEIPREELSIEICRQIVESELEGVFAIHWGSELYGKSPRSVRSPWSWYETGPGLPDEEPHFPDFDEKNLHVHAIEYLFNLENEYVEAETSGNEFVYLIPDEIYGKSMPSKRYGYKVATDWDGTIALSMYHPLSHARGPLGFPQEPEGPLDFPKTMAVISENEEYG